VEVIAVLLQALRPKFAAMLSTADATTLDASFRDLLRVFTAAMQIARMNGYPTAVELMGSFLQAFQNARASVSERAVAACFATAHK
jgi:hypothetical protein